ncbi:MAG: signal peptidase II [Balneolales bacterium]
MASGRTNLTAFSVAAFIVFALDQLSKYIIRTNSDLHYYQIIEGWLAFHYTQNPGMALGINWADTWVISLIAIIATAVIITFIIKTMHSANTGYMVCMGLIIGGALGNIFDRLFMARIENYGTFLDGHVIDFIHFTLTIDGFRVFPYIFNVADSAITVSILVLILFYKKLMPEENEEKVASENNNANSELHDEGRSEADVTRSNPSEDQPSAK